MKWGLSRMFYKRGAFFHIRYFACVKYLSKYLERYFTLLK